MSSTGALRHVVSAIAIAGTLDSCTAYGTRPASPAHGGNLWTEAGSRHFHVIADAPANEAGQMALELEVALDAIDQVAFEHTRAPVEPTTLVVFSDDSEHWPRFPTIWVSENAVEVERSAVAFLPESANAPELVKRLATLEAQLQREH